MNVENGCYFRLKTDKAYWSPTIQRFVTITPSPDLIVKVTRHYNDPTLPLVFGTLANIDSEQHIRDTKFMLVFLSEDVIDKFYPDTITSTVPTPWFKSF